MTDKRIRALVLYATSDAEPYPVRIDPDPQLYQSIVGGYLEAVHGETPADERVVFYVNEEGRIHDMPINPVATRLWHRLNPAAEQSLRGNVVVVGADGPEDADLPVVAAEAARLVHHELLVEMFTARIAASHRTGTGK